MLILLTGLRHVIKLVCILIAGGTKRRLFIAKARPTLLNKKKKAGT